LIPFLDPLRNLFLTGLAYIFIYLVGKTIRLKVIGEEKVRTARKKTENVIYAFWHNRMLLLVYAHRHRGINVIVSRSRDGELIARTAQRFGFEAVRGSSSSGGGPAQLRLLKKLTGGVDAAVAPDGPRGPRYRVQMGVIHLGQKSGCPVIPVAVSASRKLVLKSWDGLRIPCPFARAVLIYGEPVEVSPHSGLEEKRRELEKRLMEVIQKADSYYGDANAQ
jgi:lysophospholipid acyltransferase (LPLAT)-like uncharacterized protein